jgi:alkanesulfonate monooxygenase SsuD/methylene tetrahydromethanopterin reductase-like flavin-dependent oxidoreductase (luciferase family)
MNPHRMAFTQIICCADTDAEAEALYGDAVRYYHRNNPVPLEFATPPGYMTQASYRESLRRSKNVSMDQRRKASRGDLSFWEYDELGYIIAGSPERVEQRVRDLVTELRIGQLITCMQLGNMPEEVAAHNTELFGTQVIPKLRDIWSEHEDRWTPQVSQARVAAARAAGAGAAGR